jgi:hypothetical protein
MKRMNEIDFVVVGLVERRVEVMVKKDWKEMIVFLMVEICCSSIFVFD